MKKILNCLLYLWQLPQNIIGLMLLFIYYEGILLKAKNGNIICFSSKMKGGISLGRYSIISKHYFVNYKTERGAVNSNVARHEAIGHGTQSRMLGPLYLLVIGIPSLIWATLYGNVILPDNMTYYDFYTEKWADRLAKIKRK